MANAEKLHRELLAAGLPVISVDVLGGVEYSTPLTPEQETTAAAIIAAHDPVDYEAQDAEAARADIYSQFATTIADYEDALANWGTLTNAQLNEVLRRNTKVMKNLLLYLKKDLERTVK